MGQACLEKLKQNILILLELLDKKRQNYFSNMIDIIMYGLFH